MNQSLLLIYFSTLLHTSSIIILFKKKKKISFLQLMVQFLIIPKDTRFDLFYPRSTGRSSLTLLVYVNWTFDCIPILVFRSDSASSSSILIIFLLQPPKRICSNVVRSSSGLLSLLNFLTADITSTVCNALTSWVTILYSRILAMCLRRIFHTCIKIPSGLTELVEKEKKKIVSSVKILPL